VFHQNIHCHGMLFMLFVNSQSLFIQAMFGGDSGNVSSVVVLQFVDITNNFALVSANSSKEKKILEIFVVAEWRGFNNNFLQKFNQFDGKVCLQERFDCDRHIVWISAFWEGGCNNLGRNKSNQWDTKLLENNYLVNESATVGVLRNENLSPKIRLTTFDEVTGLLLEHRVIVGNGNQLIVTETFSISNICKVRISCFAEFTNNQRFVKLFELVRICYISII